MTARVPGAVRGRPSIIRLEDYRQREAEARDELSAHCEEALRFVDRAWPHVSALERMAQELGPIALKHALTLGSLLASYEHRHVGAPDEPVAVVA